MDRPATHPAEQTAQPQWVPRRMLDVRDYHRMGDAGILRREDRVELIEGELIAMSAVGAPHINSINALTRLLVRAVGDLATVSVRNPVRLSDYNEPEPDIALIRAVSPNYATTPPLAEDVFLLIEVAAASLRYDVGIKTGLYARHGIPEYWVVDVEARLVLLHREPTQLGYAKRGEARPGDVLQPLLLPDLNVAVADIFR